MILLGYKQIRNHCYYGIFQERFVYLISLSKDFVQPLISAPIILYSEKTMTLLQFEILRTTNFTFASWIQKIYLD